MPQVKRRRYKRHEAKNSGLNKRDTLSLAISRMSGVPASDKAATINASSPSRPDTKAQGKEPGASPIVATQTAADSALAKDPLSQCIPFSLGCGPNPTHTKLLIEAKHDGRQKH